MPFETLKKRFPEEGARCLKSCGKCCKNDVPMAVNEAIAIHDWITENKSFEELEAQFMHFDENPAQCPFLQPDKGCFVYPARPVVCVMFGHLPDAPGAPKIWSQQCPEGVAFTQVEVNDVLDDSMEYMLLAERRKVTSLELRMFKIQSEAMTEPGMIPIKPGSKFERMRGAKNCFDCGFVFQTEAYLTGDKILCPECHEKLKPKELL